MKEKINTHRHTHKTLVSVWGLVCHLMRMGLDSHVIHFILFFPWYFPLIFKFLAFMSKKGKNKKVEIIILLDSEEEESLNELA